jgi:hypothetical protein
MTTAKHVLNGEVAVDATAGYPSTSVVSAAR